MAYVVKFNLPDNLSQTKSPKARPFFKTSPELVTDSTFAERLEASMNDWIEIKENGLDILKWWEIVVKPGIRRLAINRTKEINIEKRRKLNLLLLRQSYLTTKIQQGVQGKLGELRFVQEEIQQWYEAESKKIVLQSRVDDILQSEKVRIFHHEQHKKQMKKSAILKLDTKKGLLVGHTLYLDHLAQCSLFGIFFARKK